MSGVYIYIIGVSGEELVKIGITNCPEKRIRQLQAGNPKPLCIHEILGPAPRDVALAIEACVHEALQERRMVGEWFRVPAGRAKDWIVVTADIMARIRAADLGEVYP